MPDAATTIDAFLDRIGVPFKRLDGDRWAVQLAGERKLTIPVMLAITGERLAIECFFMRRPQENLPQFYELLLRRNRRAYGVAFALDAVGDVYLVGQRAIEGLTEDDLDRIFGSILIEADGLFDAAIAIGFESYLAADMAWRARVMGTN